MAEVGSQPQGTRVVLFKQSSFLFSHQRRMGECRWRKKEREKCLRSKCCFCVTSPQNQPFRKVFFPAIFLNFHAVDVKMKMCKDRRTETAMEKKWRQSNNLGRQKH